MSIRIEDYILIPGGGASIGCAISDARHSDEAPMINIRLTSYYIQRAPVTMGHWMHFVEATKFEWAYENLARLVSPGDSYPVVYVSWKDAQAYARYVSETIGHQAMLPTEAQWEYACAGPERRIFPWGATDDPSEEWWPEAMEQQQHARCPVGDPRNGVSAWGCTDMHSNVMEWSHDRYEHRHSMPEGCCDPKGPEESDRNEWRVLKGGNALLCNGGFRCTFRGMQEETYRCDVIGFRLALKP